VQVDTDPHHRADPAECLRRVAALDGSGHLAERNGQWYEARLRERDVPTAAPPVRADGSYLITGGHGGLGLASAHWLAAHGARTLVLAGRGHRKPLSEDLAALTATGAHVEVATIDVADKVQVTGLIEHIRTSMPPLRGVLHAAGLTDDAPLTAMSTERLGRVLAPKVSGAWNLGQALSAPGSPTLDFIVFYSSLVSLTGSAGQSGYVMANAFLDGLAGWLHEQGLPALSVSWGAWDGIGMAARAGLVPRLARQGVIARGGQEYLAALGGLLHRRQELADGAAHVGLAAVRWAALDVTGPGEVPYRPLHGVAVPPGGAEDSAGEQPAAGSGDTGPLSGVIEQMIDDDPAGARALVLTDLLERTAAVLRIETADAGALASGFEHMRLAELGLDSLTTIRLRGSLLAALGVDISPEQLFGAASAGEIADLICRQVALRRLVAGSTAGPVGMDDQQQMEVMTL